MSIDFKFGVGDYVREVASRDKVAAKVGSGQMIVGATNTCPVNLFIFFNRATVHSREPVFAHNRWKYNSG